MNKTIIKAIKDLDMEKLLDNFETTFDKEFNNELFVINPQSNEDGFLALEEFYEEFNKETEDREIFLQNRFCNGVITKKEFEELESIAIIKYPEIKFEEIADFYKFSNIKSEKIVFSNLNESVEMI